jgi:predicted nuclease of restriction endonuclease-like (RecB) superfamily
MKVPTIRYAEKLSELKTAIHQSRLKSFLAVNTEMLLLYWKIGNVILDEQASGGRGSKIIEHLADDLRKEFPEVKGLSLRNLKYMRQFSIAYPDADFVQTALAHITWYHHITLLSKVKSPAARLLYVRETAENRWSRDEMVAHIDRIRLEK